MFETKMLGDWAGNNKLWFDKPEAELSKGEITVLENSIDYKWSFRDAQQEGTIEFFGPRTSFRASWVDSWHSKERTDLHGFEEHGLYRLYGTFHASPEVEWGWKIEIDLRDPDVVQLRMFNIEPSGEIHIAVDLRGEKNLKS